MARSEQAEQVRRGIAGDGSYHVGDDVEPEPMGKAEAAQLLGVPEADIVEVRVHEDGDLVVHASGRGTVIPVGGGGMYELEQVDPAEPEAAPEPPADPDEVPGGSTAQVLEWVGDDPERAARALEAERARETPRTGLTERLERLVSG